jgi:hypothetical protein
MSEILKLRLSLAVFQFKFFQDIDWVIFLTHWCTTKLGLPRSFELIADSFRKSFCISRWLTFASIWNFLIQVYFEGFRDLLCSILRQACQVFSFWTLLSLSRKLPNFHAVYFWHLLVSLRFFMSKGCKYQFLNIFLWLSIPGNFHREILEWHFYGRGKWIDCKFIGRTLQTIRCHYQPILWPIFFVFMDFGGY